MVENFLHSPRVTREAQRKEMGGGRGEPGWMISGMLSALNLHIGDIFGDCLDYAVGSRCTMGKKGPPCYLAA